MDSFQCYIEKYGIPVSVYLDKHSTYKSTAKPSIEDELNNREPLSQVGRALRELGINVIHADSPQAKGRIERLFKTFQDRLVKEMRLRGIKSIEGGNKFLEEYLPIYNKRFAVEAANDTDLHRPISKGLDLGKILCVKTARRLRNDWTIAHNSKVYQIEDNPRGREVMVEERIDGSMLITDKDSCLRFKEVAVRLKKPVLNIAELEKSKEPKTPTPKKVYIPPMDHPWRNFRLGGSIKVREKEEVLAGAL
jgi:hypothetical protein